MRITNVYLKILEGKGRLKAAGSITFDDEFVVKDVSVVEGKSGLFISMPSRKDEEGKYKNVAFPISRELREHVTENVLAAYRENLDRFKEQEEEVNADE